MVPPFLAYYGTITRNRTLLSASYDQVKLYRNYLHDGSANNLWKHVLQGEGEDEGHWSTGNGWAAMGMLRVLGTISNSEYGNTLKNEQKDLGKWIGEILDGMYKHFVRLFLPLFLCFSLDRVFLSG
jgi:rhamnogalacturonyl hydrolase YesR